MIKKIYFLITILIINFSISAEVVKLDLINTMPIKHLKRTITISNIDTKTSSDSINDYISLLSGLINMNVNGSNNLEFLKTDKNNLNLFNVNSASKDIQSHIIIFGTVSQSGKTLHFSLTAWDNILNKTIINYNSSINDDFYENISNYASDFIRKIIDYSSKYSEQFYTTINELLESENQVKKNLSQYIISQENPILYDYYKNNNHNYALPVIFGKINITFLNISGSDFFIIYDDQKYYSTNKILTLCFDESSLNKQPNTFIFHNIFDVNVEKPIKIVVNTDSGSLIKNIESYNTKKILETRAYFDVSNTFSTTGFTGLEFQTGLALPKMTEIAHSIYTKFNIEYNITDMIIKPELISTIIFRGVIGYQYHLHILRTFSLNFGIEAGGEITFTDKVIENGRTINTEVISPGFPALFIGFPITFNFPSSSKISFIAGLTPSIRITQKSYLYKNTVWIGNLHRSEGFLENIKINLQTENNDNLLPTYDIDLFLYNMPVKIGLKIEF